MKAQYEYTVTPQPIKDQYCDIVVFHFRRLAGKVLTVIDASIADAKQNKAMKDLLKKAFSEQISDVREYFGSKKGEACTDLEQIAVG